MHSQRNPEQDWGNDTLAAARYALFVLNDRYGDFFNPVRFTAANTIIIAGSASNGGAAVLRAAELDSSGLIRSVVASGPVTEMPGTAGAVSARRWETSRPTAICTSLAPRSRQGQP